MNSQELKHRISAVSDTVKITKAMHMIAASKMHKLQKKSEDSYMYFCEMKRVLEALGGNISHLCIRGNGSSEVAVIAAGGEKGLCGDFNHRVFALVDEFVEKSGAKTVFAVGHEMHEHLIRRGITVNNAYTHLQEPHAFDVEEVVCDIMKMYSENKFGELYLIYTKTPSLTGQEPCIKKILPIEIEGADSQDGVSVEPAGDNTSEGIIEQYIMSQIYSALADNAVAINYKRMTAMKESTDNGRAIMDMLTMEYNHRRQESITSDLLDSNASAFANDKT